MRARLLRSWSLAVLLVLVAGCRAADVTPGTDRTSEGGTDGAPGEPFVGGGGDYDLLDPAVGLFEVTNYHATLTVSFQGTLDDGDERHAQGYQVAKIGTVIYELWSEDGSCSLTSIGGTDDHEGLWVPARLLPSVLGAAVVDGEEVGGLPARRYTFGATALGMTGITDAAGEFWVHVPTGVVIKYTLSVQAGPEYLGEGGRGTLTWDYALVIADQARDVDVPEGCPPTLATVPVPPDAEDVEYTPRALTFVSASDVPSVVAYYERELAALGWELEKDTVFEELSVIAFVRGSQRLLLIAESSDGGRLAVRLVLQAAASP